MIKICCDFLGKRGKRSSRFSLTEHPWLSRFGANPRLSTDKASVRNQSSPNQRGPLIIHRVRGYPYDRMRRQGMSMGSLLLCSLMLCDLQELIDNKIRTCSFHQKTYPYHDDPLLTSLYLQDHLLGLDCR